MPSLPFVTLALQHTKGDCCIAALSMLTGIPYEDVLVKAVTKKYPRPHKGMYSSRQICDTARRLGTSLVLRRTWDLETSCGLLTVERIEKKPEFFDQHVVLLKFGLVFDTDGTVWEPETYFLKEGFKPVSLLEETTDGAPE